MFVVVGTWRMDVRHETQQREGLTRIAAAVSQLPGIVRGYWTSSDDASESYTSSSSRIGQLPSSSLLKFEVMPTIKTWRACAISTSSSTRSLRRPRGPFSPKAIG